LHCFGCIDWGHGFFLDTHGIEYALALLSATSAVVFTGGGRYSLDALIETKLLEAKDE
jgi:putative oxidoreductase